MNEPVGFARSQCGNTTAKELLSVVKQGVESLYMHGEATPNRQSYSDSYLFHVTAVSKRDVQARKETEHRIVVPGWVSNGYTSHTTAYAYENTQRVKYDEAYQPLKGFWSLSYTRLRNVLEVLPGSALVSFQVALDYGTNDLLVCAESKLNYCTEQGLHGDHLYLFAKVFSQDKMVSRQFLIDTQVSAHNSARFGSPRG